MAIDPIEKTATGHGNPRQVFKGTQQRNRECANRRGECGRHVERRIRHEDERSVCLREMGEVYGRIRGPKKPVSHDDERAEDERGMVRRAHSGVVRHKIPLPVVYDVL